MTMLDELKS